MDSNETPAEEEAAEEEVRRKSSLLSALNPVVEGLQSIQRRLSFGFGSLSDTSQASEGADAEKDLLERQEKARSELVCLMPIDKSTALNWTATTPYSYLFIYYKYLLFIYILYYK